MPVRFPVFQPLACTDRICASTGIRPVVSERQIRNGRQVVADLCPVAPICSSNPKRVVVD